MKFFRLILPLVVHVIIQIDLVTVVIYEHLNQHDPVLKHFVVVNLMVILSLSPLKRNKTLLLILLGTVGWAMGSGLVMFEGPPISGHGIIQRLLSLDSLNGQIKSRLMIWTELSLSRLALVGSPRTRMRIAIRIMLEYVRSMRPSPPQLQQGNQLPRHLCLQLGSLLGLPHDPQHRHPPLCQP
jgi:hypothetical protein